MQKIDFSFSQLTYPCLMGIVNVTPDSFSDGGEFQDGAAAIAQGRRLAEAGAGLLDVGAEASSFFRPGVTAVDAAEQLRRLHGIVPALGGIRQEVRVSVDTRSAAVAKACIDGGAAVVNDISAGTHDPAMLETVAALGAGLILMHIGAAYPANPPEDDVDIVKTVRVFLETRIAAATAAGIPKERLAIDSGVGFGKTPRDNWRLALHCHEWTDLGVPVVLGASRKRFLETPPPEEVRPEWNALMKRASELRPEMRHARDPASAAMTALAAHGGGRMQIHRVHDVTLARLALTL